MSRESKKEFLEKYYQAKEVAADGLGHKIHAAVDAEKVKYKSKKGRLDEMKEALSELKEEGSAGDQILYDDVFEVDSEAFITTEKKKLSKRTKVSLFLLLVMIPLTIAIGVIRFRGTDYDAGTLLQTIFGSRIYYFISLVIMIYAMVPFFMVFEGRKPQAREMIVLATMAALACAGRAAFFMVPSIKPVIAIVIISGIAFGGEAGFLVGAVTMLVSNFLFGQGPWTPWQMFAMGFIGFLSGILHQKGLLPAKRLTLCIYGFLVTFFVYGGIMNPAAMFMSVYEFTWSGLLAMYISGAPVDFVHACSTFIFLWLGARPLLEKLQRIKVKYGLL
ncbi:MAG: ECF transporter S component [Lachnospiraceae bacterium]|nr:ECF transporter S component [Lachnospiraceae bacterium]